MKRVAWLLFALSIALSARAEASPAGPVAVTKAAYKTALQHFGFTIDTLRSEKAYLAPDLYRNLTKKALQKVAKGDAPDIEGDVFFDAQDVPDKYEVSRYSYAGFNGITHVPVTLHWGNETRQYSVFLARTDGVWLITDIDYGKDGKLTDLLK